MSDSKDVYVTRFIGKLKSSKEPFLLLTADAAKWMGRFPTASKAKRWARLNGHTVVAPPNAGGRFVTK